MKSSTLKIFCLFALTIILLSNCKQESCDAKPNYTMAVDSELTLLMREMFDYYEGVKSKLESGTLDEKIKVFQDVHKAVATSPEKSSSEVYQAMAGIYVQSASRLNKRDVDQIQSFNQMVDNCMSCHQQMCPGPMVRIKKLYIE